MAGGREKKVEARPTAGDGLGREKNEALDPSVGIEERLPSTVIEMILSKLDLRSLCVASAACRYLCSCAIHTLSFIPSFHLLEIAPTLDLLRTLLPPNPCLRSLKLDCSLLDDCSIGYLHLDITFRRDPTNYRPRINKLDSTKDREQKSAGSYYYLDD